MFSDWQSADLGNSGEYLKWAWPFILLDLVLKGLSLWRSARRSEKWWFIALLVINTFGVLPAFYLLTHRGEVSSDSPLKTTTKKNTRKKK